MPENEVRETPPACKKDLLKTPPEEAREMEAFIAKGHQAHNVVGGFMILGFGILLLAYLYYSRYDSDDLLKFSTSFPAEIDSMVGNQVRRDRDTYVTRLPSSEKPEWPLLLYRKLRKDIYLLSGAAVLLAVVFMLIERAKLHRNDLLVYRAMAREIEKLRQRVKSLESGGKDSAPKPDGSQPDSGQPGA